MSGSPLRSLSRSLSRMARSGSTSRLLNNDKLSLDDGMEIAVDEFSWAVKMKSEETAGKKVERVLVAGPTGIRILVPTTNEELGKYPYTKMKEYTYNTSHRVFQFTWLPSKAEEETVYLSTGKSKEIHESIGKFLTNLLREKKGIKDPEKILMECTYQRAPELEKIKRGGTQRSYSTPALTGQSKRIKRRNPDETNENNKTDKNDPEENSIEIVVDDDVKRGKSTPTVTRTTISRRDVNAPSYPAPVGASKTPNPTRKKSRRGEGIQNSPATSPPIRKAAPSSPSPKSTPKTSSKRALVAASSPARNSRRKGGEESSSEESSESPNPSPKRDRRNPPRQQQSPKTRARTRAKDDSEDSTEERRHRSRTRRSSVSDEDSDSQRDRRDRERRRRERDRDARTPKRESDNRRKTKNVHLAQSAPTTPIKSKAHKH